jgi:RimJ/RimL family protein N-acetyltransferase
MIYAERIRLRRDERADLPKFVVWLNDPDVCRYLGAMNLPFSMVNEEQWFENMLKQHREEQPFAIEIRESDDWRLVGNCGFFDIHWSARSAEVGIFIGDKSCWNKGYGTEVVRLLLRLGFETLNLNRIFLRVDEANGLLKYRWQDGAIKRTACVWWYQTLCRNGQPGIGPAGG